MAVTPNPIRHLVEAAGITPEQAMENFAVTNAFNTRSRGESTVEELHAWVKGTEGLTVGKRLGDQCYVVRLNGTEIFRATAKFYSGMENDNVLRSIDLHKVKEFTHEGLALTDRAVRDLGMTDSVMPTEYWVRKRRSIASHAPGVEAIPVGAWTAYFADGVLINDFSIQDVWGSVLDESMEMSRPSVGIYRNEMSRSYRFVEGEQLHYVIITFNSDTPYEVTVERVEGDQIAQSRIAKLREVLPSNVTINQRPITDEQILKNISEYDHVEVAKAATKSGAKHLQYAEDERQRRARAKITREYAKKELGLEVTRYSTNCRCRSAGYRIEHEGRVIASMGDHESMDSLWVGRSEPKPNDLLTDTDLEKLTLLAAFHDGAIRGPRQEVKLESGSIRELVFGTQTITFVNGMHSVRS